jgi:hypothetical protein
MTHLLVQPYSYELVWLSEPHHRGLVSRARRLSFNATKNVSFSVLTFQGVNSFAADFSTAKNTNNPSKNKNFQQKKISFTTLIGHRTKSFAIDSFAKTSPAISINKPIKKTFPTLIIHRANYL